MSESCSCAFSWAFFLLFACAVQFQQVSFCFILYYFILLLSFRKIPNERKGVDPDGRKSEEELEEMQAQETVIRYILWKNNQFSIKWKNLKENINYKTGVNSTLHVGAWNSEGCLKGWDIRLIPSLSPSFCLFLNWDSQNFNVFSGILFTETAENAHCLSFMSIKYMRKHYLW